VEEVEKRRRMGSTSGRRRPRRRRRRTRRRRSGRSRRWRRSRLMRRMRTRRTKIISRSCASFKQGNEKLEGLLEGLIGPLNGGMPV
jgi:hypothetical protein